MSILIETLLAYLINLALQREIIGNRCDQGTQAQ